MAERGGGKKASTIKDKTMRRFTMAISKTLSLWLCASFAALVLGGCEKEGPVERTGKQIDEAVEKADEALRKAADKVQEATK
jgi:hypothetical protein